MKTVLIKIFIIHFSYSNQKNMLLLKKPFLSILEEHTYFVKINPKKVSDSKIFGNIYHLYSQKMEKLKNENIISEEHLVSEGQNNFFKMLL